MTKLLASVSNLSEAGIALEAGADIIDLKNPVAGALGALPKHEIRAIVSLISGIKPVSATIGDLPMDTELVMRATEQMAQTGVDIIKIGFFGSSGHHDCIQALKPLTGRGTQMVAVLFADQAPDLSLLSELQEAGFYGVMLDTADKNGKNLMDHILPEDIERFITLAHKYGLQSGLAGSLGREHIPALTRLNPGYIGFRGALCSNLKRTSALSADKVHEISGLLLRNNTTFSNMASV
ncbi:MAG TPA: (5-formylfuran-3-yl)methyl phosphate synthase [Methylophilaceae bacterium]|jgi:dihydroneopterin aldolase